MKNTVTNENKRESYFVLNAQMTPGDNSKYVSATRSR